MIVSEGGYIRPYTCLRAVHRFVLPDGWPLAFLPFRPSPMTEAEALDGVLLGEAIDTLAVAARGRYTMVRSMEARMASRSNPGRIVQAVRR